MLVSSGTINISNLITVISYSVLNIKEVEKLGYLNYSNEIKYLLNDDILSVHYIYLLCNSRQ